MIKIDENTIKNPITFIGKQAGVAYGSDTFNNEKNFKRGLQCIKDGHGRLLEFIDVYFTIEGYSNRVIREFARHVGDGLTMIQESTRYVDFTKGFDMIIPDSIKYNKDSHLIEVYMNACREIKKSMQELKANDIPKEDLQMLIPLGATTKVVIKKNLRNLIDMSRVRMCGRAYWEFRELMQELCEKLRNISSEWDWIVSNLFHPKCEESGYCTEKFSCGRKPKKEDIIIQVKKDDKTINAIKEMQKYMM